MKKTQSRTNQLSKKQKSQQEEENFMFPNSLASQKKRRKTFHDQKRQQELQEEIQTIRGKTQISKTSIPKSQKTNIKSNQEKNFIMKNQEEARTNLFQRREENQLKKSTIIIKKIGQKLKMF